MPSLQEAKKKVEELVKAKGFGNSSDEIANKLLFASIELGEAGDSWKKGRPTDETIEELIDVIFYVLDASRLIDPRADLDEVFERKWAKNMGRSFQYGEGFRKKKTAKS